MVYMKSDFLLCSSARARSFDKHFFISYSNLCSIKSKKADGQKATKFTAQKMKFPIKDFFSRLTTF